MIFARSQLLEWSPPPSQSARFLEERAATLYDHLGSIARATLAVSSVWVVALRGELPLWQLSAWWLANAVVAGGRLVMGWRFRALVNRHAMGHAVARRWIRLYALGALASGVVWGGSAGLLWVSDSLRYQVLHVCILVGLAAGAVSTSSVYRPAFGVWLAPAFLPTMLRLIAIGGPAAWGLACVQALLGCLLLLQARKQHGVHSASFQLHHDNRLLIERLRQEEVRLREANEQLELRVQQRSEQLQCALEEREQARQQLYHAQKLEAVGQLTGGVAHDFNNLLTVVIGSLDAIEAMESPNGRTIQLVDNARKAAERGAKLTHSLLAFSRKQILRPATVDIAFSLEELRRALEDSALGVRLELTIESSARLWRVRADPDRLLSALVNLCVNARDAMLPGGQVAIRADNFDQAEDTASAIRGQYVRIAVQDTGKGIAPEQLDHVFEPFFTTKRCGEGSGLGLSMVYGFCHQSGGRVHIESEVGVGTVVTLYLPRGDSAGDVAFMPPRGVLETLPSGAGRWVLVVEDEAAILELAVRMLEDLGYRVRGVTGPAAGLELLSDPQIEVDILFADVVMPGVVNGFEVAREAERLRPGLAVVVTSGFAGTDSDSLPKHWVRLRKPYGVSALGKALGRASVASLARHGNLANNRLP